MKRKPISRVLHDVDPDLTVIPGGAYPHRHSKKAVKLSEQPKPELPYYEPHQSNEDDWNDAGGVICPICGKEVTRLYPYGYLGKRKACLECIKRRRELLERKAEIVARKTARPLRSEATAARMRMIKYYAKKA